MSAPSQNRRWVLANKPTDEVKLSGTDATFKLEEQKLPSLKDGELLLKTRYLSNDPAQRGWIDATADERLYVEPVGTGELMRGGAISEVIESKDKKFEKGTLVQASSGWAEYHIKSASEVQPLRKIDGVSPTHFLGALGGTGLTAYVGVVKIAELKKGDSLVVSGAAGATGSMAVQIAKHIVGASKVVGIAGSDEKCRWVEKLGADVCINYKKPDWKEQLAKATDGFVDAYYDGVGGEQLDFMLTRLKTFGRVAACGAIADYNSSEKSGLKNWWEVIQQRLSLKGFIVTDHLKNGEGAKITETLSKAVEEGKLRISDENETVVDTKFEEVPNTWVKLFSGGNTGKLVSKIV